MKTQKLGVLYANDLVKDGGYISDKQIKGAYTSVYGHTKVSDIAEDKLIIRQITQKSCADVYIDFQRKNVKHILVLGDDASIIFNYFYENLNDTQKTIPWTSALASFQFNKNVHKIWMSQEVEIATIVNFIRQHKGKNDNFKIATILTSETSSFTKYFQKKIQNVLERYDIKLLDNPEEADTIIVIGLGDRAHVQKINSFLPSRFNHSSLYFGEDRYKDKLIVTNSAILEVLDNLKKTVYCTDIYRLGSNYKEMNKYKYESVTIKLPELFLKLAFYITSIDSCKGFFYSDYLDYPLYFDEENYIQIPVEIVKVESNHKKEHITQNYKDYVTSLEQLSNSITGGIGVDDNMYISYGILEVSCIFNYNQNFIVESQKQYGDQCIRNHDFQVYNNIIESIINREDDILFPIQINLEEEDVNDNATYRLSMKIDGTRRYPIVIPTDIENKKVDICLVPNLTCSSQTEVCVKIGNLQNFIEEINVCRSNFNYLYILPYVEGKNKFGYTFIGSRKKLSSIHLHLWQLKLTPIVSKLHVECISKTILKESLKSAVSAIMTRNMSHNLGSHYLHYTKTHLEQIAEKGGELGPDIRGAARVMGYIQGRMEYLATLVSGDRYPYGCVNFKSQIFDELTIDDFSKRHFEIEQGRNLSAVYDEIADIVDEIYENGCNEKIIKQYIPELYNHSKKTKYNNSHNRTTNFLLANLIFSEGFTRSNILDGKDADNSIKINVRYGNEIFTGSSEKTDLERHIKERLSKINIALPGGILSCHAFFNVVENFIRNSAKYHRNTFQKNDNDIQYLTTTIRIIEEGDYYKFTIYDNKQNALSILKINDKYTTLIESIRDRLRTLHILDNDNSIDKNNKGFKEILFSTIWLRAFVYMHEKEENCPNSYANVLMAIQSALDGDEKMQLIEKYGFKVIAVDDNGDESSTEQHRDEHLKANLALQFTLPKYNRNIAIDFTSGEDINSLLNVYGDVVYYDKSKLTSLLDKINDNLQKRIKQEEITEDVKVERDLIFPRSTSKRYANTEIGAIEAFKEVLHRRFGKKEFEKYQVIFGNLEVEIKDKYKIFFDRHLSSQKDMSLFTKYAYADSISGGNFTITLTEMYNQWVKEGCKEDISEYYTILKIKESALTRITFIDERLYGEMHKQNMETELACRNIRVLNYQEPKSTSKKDDFLKLFIGNKFHRGGNTTHFLSIHLGLVEKIVQESKAFNSMSDESGKRYSEYNLKDRTIKFMDLLKKYFGDKNQKVFISIHSGRGNFSAELDGPLAIYPFIGMTAIENAYSNSKYLLCQLFYSTIYLGKGVANEHNNNQ